MENMESMANTAPEQEAQQAEALVESSVTEDTTQSESLESLLAESVGQETQGAASEEAEGTGAESANEPGYVRKRIDKALAKQAAELQAQFDAKLNEALAPYREQMIETQARELVRNGSVKDLETAKELVRYRQNQPQPAKEQQPTETGSQQPRNDKGQFAQQRDAAKTALVNMLTRQADRIKERTGIDVTEVFMKDADVKEKVLSGEWDFNMVLEHINGQQQKKPPAPMRSPNGASGSEKSTIAGMSDEAFKRLEKNLKEGKRYSI